MHATLHREKRAELGITDVEYVAIGDAIRSGKIRSAIYRDAAHCEGPIESPSQYCWVVASEAELIAFLDELRQTLI